MTKLLILMLFAVNAYGKDAEPKFYKGQKVTYKVPFFFHKVCSGKGTIDNAYLQFNPTVYDIKVPELDIVKGCLDPMNIEEKDIKAAE